MKKNRSGFTLIELLVVVAIIGVLIAILIPALGTAKQLAQRTLCATHLKGQGTSYSIYAAQYGGQVPNGGLLDAPSSDWLHDDSIEFCNTMLGIQTSAGMDTNSVRKWFYCPANTIYDLDQFWNVSIVAGIPNKRTLGYASLRQRGLAVALPGAVLPSPRVPPLVYRLKWNPAINASGVEILEDIILTQNPPTPSTNFGLITQSSSGAYVESVSHVKGTVPAGANALFLDGHVSWLNWGGTPKAHWVTCGAAGNPSGVVYFTLIDPY